MQPRADLLYLIAAYILRPHREAGHVADGGSLRVPVPRDLPGILLIEHRIEDRLLRQARRPFPPAALPHEIEFRLPRGAIEDDRLRVSYFVSPRVIHQAIIR